MKDHGRRVPDFSGLAVSLKQLSKDVRRLERSPAPPPDRNPALVYLKGLAQENARKTMSYALYQAARLLSEGQKDALTLAWQNLRRGDIDELRDQLAQRYRPATVNKVLAGVRGCLKAAWRMGLMSLADYYKAVDVPNVAGSSLPAGRALVRAESEALLRVCREDRTPIGARDAAALALMVGAGLGRAEAVSVRIEHYDAGSGKIHIPGKGGRSRAAYMDGEAVAIIAGWIEVRGGQPGPLLCPIVPRGRIEIHPLTGQALMLRLKERCRQAGIRPCSPHDLRRTFISSLVDAGADSAVVQHLVRNANPAAPGSS